MSFVQKLSLTETVQPCISPCVAESSCGFTSCGGALAIRVRHGSKDELEGARSDDDSDPEVYLDDGVASFAYDRRREGIYLRHVEGPTPTFLATDCFARLAIKLEMLRLDLSCLWYPSGCSEELP